MEDDTIYIPRNDGEKRILKEKGVRAFRQYRRDLFEMEEKRGKEEKA